MILLYIWAALAVLLCVRTTFHPPFLLHFTAFRDIKK